MKPILSTSQSVNAELPPLLLPWVTFQGALTEQLKQTAGDARLDVIGQRFEYADAWDKQVLRIENDRVLHREIVMYAWSDPCWYARTIIPDTTYQADLVFFDRLQQESLGAMIFNEPKIKRIDFMYYPIGEWAHEYDWLNQLMIEREKTLWVRRSIFTLNNSFPFFLVEILLPGLMRYLT